MGMDASYGDATDPEFVAHMDLTGVQAVVSAVPRDRGALTEADPQLALLHGLRSANYRGRVFLSVQKVAEADELLHKGASVVLKPFDDAADYAVRQLIGADADDDTPDQGPVRAGSTGPLPTDTAPRTT